MVALLATMPTPTASSSSRHVQIKIPKWTDDDIPFEYFNKFERAMSHNGIAKGTWGQLLPVYLSGRAQASYAQVDVFALDDYDIVKNTMLESLGDTPASADRKWWTLSRHSGEEAGSFYLRVRSTGIRRLDGLTTREEVSEKMILSRYLSLLSSDCYTSVVARKPRNGLEAAGYVQEFEEARTFAKRHQPWKSSINHSGGQPYNKRDQEKGGVASSAGGNSQKNVSSGTQVSEVNSSQPKYSKRKQITCFGCGELGHIRPNCPNKVRRVVSPESDNVMIVDGYIEGTKVSGLRVETGSDRTIVNARFVPECAYENKTVILDSWRGKQFSKHRVAKLQITVGDVKAVVHAAVADNLECPALLGNDLGAPMKVQLLSMVLEKVKGGQSVSSEEKIDAVRMTRARSSE